MGMHKFWSVALPFDKVAYVVKGFYKPISATLLAITLLIFIESRSYIKVLLSLLGTLSLIKRRSLMASKWTS